MTPKEKAKELLIKYSNLTGGDIGWEYIKQCACISVDELLFFMDRFDLDLDMAHQYKWWQQVKQEIEKL